jgi:glutamyl-Q tRNA(Asp) synthetase
VTQVVRGEDLLSSTPRQIFLQSCLGYPVPDYVHLPLALAPDGEKISKRHGATAVDPGAGGGILLWRGLRFLGQPVPADLSSASPAEVLAWGVDNFALDRVPPRSAVPTGA